MSEGIKSGVNWIRLNDIPRALLSDLTSRVLPRPGTPSSSTWPPAKKAIRTLRIRSSWPTMTFRTSASSRLKISRNCSGSITLPFSSTNNAAIFNRQLLFFGRRVGHMTGQRHVADRHLRPRAVGSRFLRRPTFSFGISHQFFRQLDGHIAPAANPFVALTGFVVTVHRRTSLRRLLGSLILAGSIFRSAFGLGHFFFALFFSRLIWIGLIAFGVAELLIFFRARFLRIRLR